MVNPWDCKAWTVAGAMRKSSILLLKCASLSASDVMAGPARRHLVGLRISLEPLVRIRTENALSHIPKQLLQLLNRWPASLCHAKERHAIAGRLFKPELLKLMREGERRGPFPTRPLGLLCLRPVAQNDSMKWSPTLLANLVEVGFQHFIVGVGFELSLLFKVFRNSQHFRHLCGHAPCHRERKKSRAGRSRIQPNFGETRESAKSHQKQRNSRGIFIFRWVKVVLS